MKRTAAALAVPTLVLCLLTSTGLKGEEPPADANPEIAPPGGLQLAAKVEKLELPCEATERDIELAPVTEGVEVFLPMHCRCFNSAEEAMADLERFARESRDGMFVSIPQPQRLWFPVEVGKSIDWTGHCYQPSQYQEYWEAMRRKPVE